MYEQLIGVATMVTYVPTEIFCLYGPSLLGALYTANRAVFQYFKHS